MPPQIKQAKLETLEATIKEVGSKYQIIGSTGGSGNEEQDKKNEENVANINYANKIISDLLTKLRAQKELIEKEI